MSSNFNKPFQPKEIKVLIEALNILAKHVTDEVLARVQLNAAAATDAPQPIQVAAIDAQPDDGEPDIDDANIDARTLFLALGKSCGREAQVKVLKEFGAAKFTEVDPDQHHVMAIVMKRMINGASDE